VNKALSEQLRELQRSEGRKGEPVSANIHLVDDIFPLMANKDGSCNTKLLPDELHLNEAGYEVWATALAPHIAAAKGRWQAQR